MGLFSSVRSDVACLVLETVEGLVTERALVRPREILPHLVVGRLLWGILEQRRHEAHGGCGHGTLWRWICRLLVVLCGSLWV
jgi:hypothetical protein